MIGIALFAVIIIVNFFINPQYIEDKTKPPTECHNDQWTGFNVCTYPKIYNENYWIGYLAAGIAIILYFALIDIGQQQQILTLGEVWNTGIAHEDKVNFKIPPLSMTDFTWFVPKLGGTVAIVRYHEESIKGERIDHYIAIDMTSDRKATNSVYSRKSALISHIAEIVPWSQAQQMSQVGSKDLASQVAAIENKIEQLTGQKTDITKSYSQSVETLRRQKDDLKQKIEESDEDVED